MRNFLSLVALIVLAGCLTTSAPSVATWTVEFAPEGAPSATSAAPKEGAPRGSVRVSQVAVRAPYDARSIAVLRANGSLAFDPYNQFAALPSALLKGAFQDALQACGDFPTSVAATSRLATDLAAELTVTRLALDCRAEGTRAAVVELTILLVKDRALYASAQGAGVADAADGDYSKAFSKAFSQAVAEAVKKL